jgi:DNA-binding CsgD family transcriptional regulator
MPPTAIDPPPVIVRLRTASVRGFRGELRRVPLGANEYLWLIRDVTKMDEGRQRQEEAAEQERRSAQQTTDFDELLDAGRRARQPPPDPRPGSETGPRASGASAPELTAWEREVLGRLAQGWSPKTIARDLDISINTCRGFIRTILDKLGVPTQLAAVIEAARLGLITGPGLGTGSPAVPDRLSAEEPEAPEEPEQPRADEPPTCPTCSADLGEQGVWSTRSIVSAEQAGAPRSFTFIYCRACGTVVAVLPGDPSA